MTGPIALRPKTKIQIPAQTNHLNFPVAVFSATHPRHLGLPTSKMKECSAMTKDHIADEMSPEFMRYPCRVQPGPVIRSSLRTDTPTRISARPCTRSVELVYESCRLCTGTKKIDEPEGSLDRMIDLVTITPPLEGFITQIREKRRRCSYRQTATNHDTLYQQERTWRKRLIRYGFETEEVYSLSGSVVLARGEAEIPNLLFVNLTIPHKQPDRTGKKGTKGPTFPKKEPKVRPSFCAHMSKIGILSSRPHLHVKRIFAHTKPLQQSLTGITEVSMLRT
jgi:hypothetical protein